MSTTTPPDDGAPSADEAWGDPGRMRVPADLPPPASWPAPAGTATAAADTPAGETPPPGVGSPWPPAPPSFEPWGATPPPAPTRRRRVGPAAVTAAVVLLLAGGGVGATIAAVVRGGGGGSSSTSTVVDTRPLPAGAEGDAVAVAARLSSAVGTIIVGSGSTASGLGSGFVIANTGGTSYLVTNNHVVSGASTLHLVMPSGKTYPATVVGTDPLVDVAVVSVPAGNLPVAAFGKSSELKVGQSVVAIGSPLGNAGSVTAGVVSALHRTIQAGGNLGGESETLQDVLQTDTPISPGNSGGPLADTSARVVGVNVAVSGQGSNIGFSIPSDVAQRVAQQLMNHQTVQHPFVGVGYMDPIDALQSGRSFDGPGVMVTSVQAGSPAAQAGVRQGDIIISVDGVTLDNGQTLGGVIQGHRVGEQVTLSLRRGGQTLDVSVTLAERPSQAG